MERTLYVDLAQSQLDMSFCGNLKNYIDTNILLRLRFSGDFNQRRYQFSVGSSDAFCFDGDKQVGDHKYLQRWGGEGLQVGKQEDGSIITFQEAFGDLVKTTVDENPGTVADYQKGIRQAIHWGFVLEKVLVPIRFKGESQEETYSTQKKLENEILGFSFLKEMKHRQENATFTDEEVSKILLHGMYCSAVLEKMGRAERETLSTIVHHAQEKKLLGE